MELLEYRNIDDWHGESSERGGGTWEESETPPQTDLLAIDDPSGKELLACVAMACVVFMGMMVGLFYFIQEQ